MARLMIRVLGSPRIVDDGGEVRLPAQKALGLLYFLAVQPRQNLSRSRLVALLWEESTEREGRNSLSVALSRLRQSLPTLPVVADATMLCWRPEADTWVDANAFSELTTDGATIEELERAVALWRGPFLDGFAIRDSAGYEEWLRLEQESWQERVLEVLDRLVTGYEATGNWNRALAHARRGLVVDPLQEHFHRAVMRVLARVGDRAAAIAQYRACQELLELELGAEPDPETTALHEAIVHGRLSRRGVSSPSARADRPVLRPVYPAPAVVPLVGRERELGALRAALAQTGAHGRGRLVTIQGEAGIGKSRLVEELLGSLNQEGSSGWNVLVGCSYEAEGSLPYRPFIDALMAVLPGLDVAALGLSEIWLTEVARLLPDLALQTAALPAAAQLDPTQQRQRLFEGIARLLGALGAPLLVVLDDLHWADEGTLQLLAFILRHEVTQGFVVLATVRSEDLQEDLATLLRSLEREGRHSAVRLERLSADDTVALLHEMVRDGVDHLGERLHAETEGNPLFAVEMVRSLLEQGTLRPSVSQPDLHSLVLPDTVQAVIASRLARLDEAARGLLNAAAVFRRGASFDPILAISGLPEAEGLDALERLLHTQLLRETAKRGDQEDGAEELYVFGHDKIRQAVYEGLSAARRRILHRRAVEALEAGAAPVEELAYHAYRGHLWERALDGSEAAAGEARRVLGYAAATRLYEQALDCLAHLPPGEAGERREIELRLQLAGVGFYVRPGALIDWLAPAEAAALALGDATLVARVQLVQAGALYIQGRFNQALPQLERLAHMPTIAASAGLQAQLLNTFGRLLVLRGEVRRAEATLRQALPLMEGHFTPLDLLVSTDMLAAALAYRGDFAAALELAEAMRRRAEELGDPTSRGIGQAFLEIIAQTRGDWAAAVRHGRQAITLSQEGTNAIYEYVGHVFLGLAEARSGDVAGGLATARQAVALAERAQIKVLLGRCHGWLGAVLLAAGELDEALVMAQRGQAIAHEYGFTLEGAICARIVAEIHTARGEWNEAEAALRAAFPPLEELEALPEQARAEAALSRLAAAQDDGARAVAAARRAAAHFTRLGMHQDLADLERALAARGLTGSVAAIR